MKKFLFVALSLLMTMQMMAIGRGDGSTKANAIEFDWAAGNVQNGGAMAVWYRVSLDPLYDEENPTLALYLTNLVSDDAVVTLDASIAGNQESRTYTIAGKQNKVWSVAAGMLVRMHQTEVYLTLKSDKKVALSAKVYETSDIDEACKDAHLFNWATGSTQAAGQGWWSIDLTDAKAATDKDLKLSLKNQGTATATVEAAVSFDCPSSGLTTKMVTLAPGQVYERVVARSQYAMLVENEIFYRLTTDQSVLMTASLVDQPATPVFDACASALTVLPGEAVSVPAGTTLYKIPVDSLRGKKLQPEITVTAAAAATVTARMAYECPAYSTNDKTLSMHAGQVIVKDIEKNLIDGLAEGTYAYIQIETTAPLQVSTRLKHIHEGDACKTSIDFNWATGHQQEGGSIQWYAIDVTEAKRDIRDIKVSLENLTGSKANVKADIAFSCPYTDLQSMSRSVAAHGVQTTTIAYSTYAMFSDTIYVGLTTDQKVKIYADTVATAPKERDEACLSAVEFDWVNGARQYAGDTVWYKIGLNSVRNSKDFPKVYVHNMTDGAITIFGELSLECPDTIANQTRSLNLSANQTYEKQLSRDMFSNIQQDTVYLRVVATGEVAFEIRMTEEEEGASCSSAIRFNWVAGNDQKANENLWYAIDLRDAKASDKDVLVTIVNKGSETCSGMALLAYDCPCDGPQSQSFSLAANASRSHLFPHSSLETVDSVLYIRLLGSTALHVEAKLVDPAPFDTIDCPAFMQPLDWNTVYYQTTDTAWYILTADVLSQLAGSELTPELHVNNDFAGANKAKVEVAYHCPITAAMLSKTYTLADGEEVVKLLERGTAEQLSKKDTIIVRIIAEHALNFEARLVVANTGNDCMHAVHVSAVDTILQDANTTMWYKLDIAKLKQEIGFDKSMHFVAQNLGADATVYLEVYDDCQGKELITDLIGDTTRHLNRTIEAHKSISKSFPAYAIQGLRSREIYLKVRTNQSLKIQTSLKAYAPAASQDVKEQAKLLAPNVEYTVNGDAWFQMCLPMILKNYELTDDTHLIMRNANAADAAVTVSATWLNPVEFQLPERTRTIKANKSYSKSGKELVDALLKKAGLNYSVAETQASFLDSLAREVITDDSLVAYFHVKSTQPITIRLNMAYTRGDRCDNAVIFDWEHGNVNPADQRHWYQVKLDSLLIPDTCDLRLHLDNWSVADSCKAKGDMYFDCAETATTGMTYTLVPDSCATKDIDRDFFVALGWADMLIDYKSDKDTRIWVELIPDKPREEDHDTIFAIVCPEIDYLDTVTMELHHIAAGVDTVKWNDTVAWLDGVCYRDSITHFWILPYQLVPVLDEDSLLKINAAPVVAQTAQLLDTVNANLLTYYQNFDEPIMYVDTAFWALPSALSDTSYLPLTQDSLNRASGAITLRAVIEDRTDCDLRRCFDLTFSLCKDTIVPGYVDTIGYDSVMIDGVKIEGTMEYQHTYVGGAACGADSIVTYHVFIRSLYRDTAYLDTCASVIAAGLNWRGQTLTAAGEYKDTLLDVLTTWEDMHLYEDTIFVLELSEVAAVTGPDTTATVYAPVFHWYNGQTLLTSGSYDGTLVAESTGCDSIINLELWMRHLTVDTVPLTLCQSQLPYDWNGVSITGAGQFETDTILDALTTFSPGYTYQDQKHVAKVTVLSNPAPVDTFATAYDSFTWYGETYTQSCDTARDLAVTSCDSIVTLHLTIRHLTMDTTRATICASEAPFIWRGNSYLVSDTVTLDTLKATAPMAGVYQDSVCTLILKVNPVYAVDTTATAYDSFTWYGETYTQSCDTARNLVAVTTCDSIVTLHLTIRHLTMDTLRKTICASEAPFIWRGNSYSVSDTVTLDTLKATAPMAGVYQDSVCTLILKVNPIIYADTTYATAYDSYTWNGNTYTTSGVYNETFTAETTGCDSIAPLKLIIRHVVEDTTFVTVCRAEMPYLWKGQTLTTAGDFYDTDTVLDPKTIFQTDYIYMDHVAMLRLTVNDAKTSEETVTACGSYEWNGETYYKDGDYTFTTTAVNGCDSVVTLHLTLINPKTIDLPAVSKYGNRLFVIHRNDIEKQVGSFRAADVTWYREVTPGVKNPDADVKVGVGEYLTEPNGGVIPAGTYYAVIFFENAKEGCDWVGETVELTSVAQVALRLVPTSAAPGEEIRLENLDADSEAVIRVYNSTGVLIEQYSASQVETFFMRAATLNGYYMVDVDQEGQRTTLRYIVK